MAGKPSIFKGGRLKKVPDEILSLPFFYPEFEDSRSATKRVEQCSMGPGSFLLRLSSKGENYLSLSVSIDAKSVRHVNVVIEKKPTLKYYIVEEVKFNSFYDLQRYYGDHRICNQEQIENVKLRYPINKSSDSSGSFSHNGAIDVPQSGPRNAEFFMPETPASQKLTPQFGFGNEGEPKSNGDQYLASPIHSASSGRNKRKNSNANRPLPKTPGTVSKEENVKRPPYPLPPVPNSTEYYSRPRPEDLNMIDQLREVLRETESELCDCGIPLTDSELPEGWTLHRSNDEQTYGRLFYQSKEGETTWILPLAIVPLITSKQRRIILKLSKQSGIPPPQALMAQPKRREEDTS